MCSGDEEEGHWGSYEKVKSPSQKGVTLIYDCCQLSVGGLTDLFPGCTCVKNRHVIILIPSYSPTSQI